MSPQIAIISENTLCSMALRGMLSDMAPGIDVVCYRSIEEYEGAGPKMVAHHFVSASIAFQHPEIFQPIMRRTIIITEGEASPFQQTGFRTIDATASEQEIVRTILHIHQQGHGHGHSHGHHPCDVNRDGQPQLSSRERDVLALVVKGYINKEIAEQLNISPATVIFHRNNISEKLKTRSIGRLTIYAVLNKIVSLTDI